MKISCRSKRVLEAVLCFVALFLLVAIIVPAANAQGNPPRLVPYTITTIAGSATAPAQNPDGSNTAGSGTLCGTGWPASNTGTGPTWTTPPFDALGDGCLANQSLLNAPRYALADPFGTVWVLDTGDGVEADVRWVNPQTGIITAYNFGSAIAPNDSSPRGMAFDIAGNAYYMGENKSKGWKIDYVSGGLTQTAGNTSGGSGCSGDAVPALGDGIDNPSGVAPDTMGNLYFVDNKCFRVRRIDSTGVMHELLGNGGGSCGFTVVGTTASPTVPAGYPYAQPNAKTTGLNTPYAVTVDPFGNVYVANQTCYAVMEVLVDPTTVVNGVGYATQNSPVIVIAGEEGITPSGYTYPQTCFGNEPCGPATSTPMEPYGLQVDPEGPVKDSLGEVGYNLYIQESSHIWYFDFATKTVRRLAGGNANCPWVAPAPGAGVTGPTSLGDSCPATNSIMSTAYGIDIDALGNLYVGDDGDNVIREVFKGPEMTDGSALWFQAPYVPQYYPGGTPVPFDGIAIARAHFEPGDSAAATNPFSVFGDFSLPSILTGETGTTEASPTCATNPFDGSSDCLFSINYAATRAGTVSAPLTVTGTTNGTTGYSAVGVENQPAIAVDPGVVTVLSSSVSNPGGVAVDSLGNWYVADTGNNRILKNGVALVSSGLNAPQGVAVDGAGNVYIADTGDNLIKEWSYLTKKVTTIAGGGTPCSVTSFTFNSDSLGNNCPATQTTFNQPTALAVDSLLNLYILDQGNAEVRRLDPRKKTMSLVAGGGGAGIPECAGGNSHPRCATLNTPVALSVGAPGLVYVVEGGSTNDIKEINLLAFPATITQVAMNSTFTNPSGVGVDAAGNIYYSDAGYQVVGMSNAVASSADQLVLGLPGTAGDTAIASSTLASLVAIDSPGALAVDAAGNVYVADAGNNRILKVDRTQSAIPFNSVAPGQTVAWSNVTATNTGTQPLVLQALSIGGTNPNDFSIDPQGTNCSTTAMAPGASCDIVAAADPTDSGALSATIALAGNSINTPVIQLIAQGAGTPTSTALSFNPIPQVSQQFSIMKAVVTPSTCTGNVSFFVNGDLAGTAALDGTGTASLAFPWKDHFLAACSDFSVQALYSDPSGVCSDSQMLTPLVLTPAPTTVSLAESGGTVSGSSMTIVQYQMLTLTSSVSSPSGGAPTGSVEYWVTGLPGGDVPLSSILVPQEEPSVPPPSIVTLSSAGAAVYTTGFLPPGTYKIYGKYSGDCHFSASTSAIVTVTVTTATWDFCMNASKSVACTPGAPVTMPIAVAQVGPLGSVATATIDLWPINYPGSDGKDINGTTTVTFTCSGVPAYSTCTFGPNGNPLVLTSSIISNLSTAYFVCPNYHDQPCAITMDLVVNLASHASVTQPKEYRLGWPALAALALMCPGLFFVGAGLSGELRGRKGLRRKLLFLIGMLLLLCILLGLPGCGGNLKQVNAVTPAGTYPITVTATMAGQNGTTVVHTAVVPVTVPASAAQ
jgi:hypothetical protein